MMALSGPSFGKPRVRYILGGGRGVQPEMKNTNIFVLVLHL